LPRNLGVGCRNNTIPEPMTLNAFTYASLSISGAKALGARPTSCSQNLQGRKEPSRFLMVEGHLTTHRPFASFFAFEVASQHSSPRLLLPVGPHGHSASARQRHRGSNPQGVNPGSHKRPSPRAAISGVVSELRAPRTRRLKGLALGEFGW